MSSVGLLETLGLSGVKALDTDIILEGKMCLQASSPFCIRQQLMQDGVVWYF